MKYMIVAGIIVGAILVETGRAESKILSSITSSPPYIIDDGPLVSVIIITLNESHYLPALLAALNNQTYQNFEVIVVDNGSTDDTAGIAASWGATILTNSEYNLALSRNIGAASAHGDILVFIDADTVPEHQGIEKVVESIQEGHVLVYTNKCSTDSYLHSIGRVTFGMVSLPPMYVSSCFLAMSKEAFNAVGGFPEDCLAQEGCGEDIRLVQIVREIYGLNRVSYLRTTYVGTSSRRQKVEGLLPPQHWGHREIRLKILARKG